MPGRAEADVVLLGVLLVEAEAGRLARRDAPVLPPFPPVGGRDEPLGELDDALVVEVAGGADDDRWRRCSGRCW